MLRVLTVLQTETLDAGMPGQNPNQFGATIAAIANNPYLEPRHCLNIQPRE
jgi:hypothetical protein